MTYDFDAAFDIDIPTNVEYDGETFTNELDARYTASTTIRNCAFTPGEFENRAAIAAMDNPDGVLVFDYCYFEGNDGQNGVFADPNRESAGTEAHTGTMYFRNCHFTHFGSDALYAETADPHGEGGIVLVDNCYFENNNISHIRVSGGSKIRNCVVHNTNDVPENENGDVNSRGLHTFYEGSGTVEVENTHVDVTDGNTNGAASAITIQPEPPEWVIRDSELDGERNDRNNATYTNVGTNPDTTQSFRVPDDADDALDGMVTATDTFTVFTRNGALSIPVYDPSGDTPVRVAVPDGSGGTDIMGIRLANPTLAHDHAARVATAGGDVYALDASPPVTIVTDFEDASFADWDGTTSGYDITQSAPVYHGDYSLKNTTTSYQDIRSMNGLNAYPAPGTTMKYNIWFGADNDVHELKWGRQHGDAEYYLRVDGPDNELELGGDYASPYTTRDTDFFDHPNNEWLTGTLIWDTNGYQYVEFATEDGDVLASVSDVDTTHDEGGIAIVTNPASNSDGIILDYFRLIE